jgi:hypothetical protein
MFSTKTFYEIRTQRILVQVYKTRHEMEWELIRSEQLFRKGNRFVNKVVTLFFRDHPLITFRSRLVLDREIPWW